MRTRKGKRKRKKKKNKWYRRFVCKREQKRWRLSYYNSHNIEDIKDEKEARKTKKRKKRKKKGKADRNITPIDTRELRARKYEILRNCEVWGACED